MGKVLYLPTVDMPADVVLERAKDQGIAECLVIGALEDGMYIACTTDDIARAMWLLERGRQQILDIASERGLL